MLPTPDLSHLSRSDYENVYEPAEDTFILLDALEADESFLKARNPALCLEIGSGSGCVSAFLSKMIGHQNSLYCCTDINPYAVAVTKRTGMHNKVPLEVIRTSLATSLSQRCKGQIDILIFNPPYVPTKEEEREDSQRDGTISSAWAGGTIGMNVTNELLEQSLLSPSGCFYLVAVKENNPADIMKRMEDIYGLKSAVVIARRAGREYLHVLRFCKTL